jgi:alpha-ketoglutarate-dependent taurine dioxygenase
LTGNISTRMTDLVPPNPTTPYATILGHRQALSTLSIAEFIAAYKRYGAVLLRGFEVDLSEFRDLTQSLCFGSVFNESPGRVVIDREQNIQTVNLGYEPFPQHPELSREPWKPDICFFWCIKSPSKGGETTVCDGVEIVRRLPPAVKNAFSRRRLRYQQPATAAEIAFWLGSHEPDAATIANPPVHCPYSFVRNNGEIHRYFLMPALHKPMFSDEPAFGNFLFFGRYFNRQRIFPTFENGESVPDDLLAEVKAVSDQVESPVAWQPGDIVILDNTRFMHGRRAILDLKERHIATYFGYVHFAVVEDRERHFPWRVAAFKPPVFA